MEYGTVGISREGEQLGKKKFNMVKINRNLLLIKA